MRIGVFRVFTTLFAILAGAALYGQYPATGNKSRLGWQTTADGLVWRGAIGDTATIDPVGLLQAWAIVDTASGVLYQYRGKAWRPVLAYAIQPFDSITFNNNEGDADSAELKYNADIGSLVYGANDGAQIPVLPGHWYVRNDTSVTIPKGTLVRASGTLGASGRIKVKHMIANATAPAEYILGIVAKDIPAGEDGYVMFQGKIRKLNTDAWNEGDLLYPDDATPGGLTNGPVYFKTPIAFVVHKSATQGVIAVRINPENYLSRLHDVTLPGLAAQNILRYNGTYWIPGRDTSLYDFDARLKGNRTVLMNNFDTKFRNAYGEDEYVQIRPTFVAVRDSFPGYNVVLNKFGIDGNGSSIKMAGGIQLSGYYAANTPGVDPDISITDDGIITFRVSAPGAVDSLYGKTAGGLLTAIKPNYLAYTDTASMLSTYLRPSEILAGTNITLTKDSAVTINAPITHTGSTAVIDVAEVVVDALGTLRLPWDGAAVVGVIKTGLYFTSGVNNQFVQYELIPNGDKGDITTSAGGAVMTIDTGAVTGAKLGAITSAELGAALTDETGTGAAVFGTSPTISGATITTGSINNTPIGASTANTGAFTTLTASSTLTVTGAGSIQGLTVGRGNNALLENTALGISALSKAVAGGVGYTGSFNTAIGYHSLRENTVGDENVAIGYRAMVDADSFDLNVAIGSGALENNKNNGNTAIGASALNKNTKGIGGTGVGAGALFANTTGSENTAIGVSSLEINTTGNNNTALGYQAGFGNTIGSNNVYLGYKSNGSANNNWNEIVIGSGAVGIGRNSVTIGNDTIATTLLRGRVGIRQSAPQQALHVRGKVRADTLNSTPLFIAGIGTDSTLIRLSTDSLPSIAELKIVKGLQAKIDSASIYKTNGTLTGHRTVNMDAKNIYFKSNAASDDTIKIGYDAELGYNSAISFKDGPVRAVQFEKGIETYSTNFGVNRRAYLYMDAGDLRFYADSSTNLGTPTAATSALNIDRNAFVQVRNLGRRAPVTVTDATYTVADNVTWIICNRAGTVTLTLPSATTYTGRELTVKTIQAQTVISAASNVVPITDTAAGTAILPATDGAWALLVSDGTNWIIMQQSN